MNACYSVRNSSSVATTRLSGKSLAMTHESCIPSLTLHTHRVIFSPSFDLFFFRITCISLERSPDPRSGGSEDNVDSRIRFDQFAHLPNFETVSSVL